MGDTKNITVPAIRPWRAGETLSEGRLNETTETVNRLVRGVEGPRQVGSGMAAPKAPEAPEPIEVTSQWAVVTDLNVSPGTNKAREAYSVETDPGTTETERSWKVYQRIGVVFLRPGDQVSDYADIAFDWQTIATGDNVAGDRIVHVFACAVYYEGYGWRNSLFVEKLR